MTEPETDRSYRGIDGVAHPIVQIGDPVLAAPCVPVTAFDEALHRLIADMFASMAEANGVGLAANQIGVGLRVFVYDCPDLNHVRHRGVVVNPVLELPPVADRRLVDEDEGCLSVAGQYAPLARPNWAHVSGVDGTGAPVTVTGTGLLARCLQHECDHLDGMLYVDRLPAKARRRVLRDHAER